MGGSVAHEKVDPTVLLQPAATRVRDPVSGRSVWLAGMVQEARERGDGDLQYELAFDAGHTPHDRKGIPAAIEENLRGLGFEGKIFVMHGGATPSLPQPSGAPPAKTPAADPVPGMTGPGMQAHGGPVRKDRIPGVKHVIAVASGKGGVGKSTVATNLAVSLAKAGHGVGLLDADIYGPSVPLMMRTSARPMVDPELKRILPVEAHGVKLLSMGLLVDADTAMIWRGPMVMGAVRQFLQEASWEGCDYLIIDLPPGTGDAQLTLVQAVDLAGAVIVTTPQPVALGDAVRGIAMFRKLDVPLLGLIENMAWYELPDGTRDHIFGEGGGVATARRFETELLGQIPLRSAIRRGGDEGLPAALSDDAVGATFARIAERIHAKLPLDAS
jgi:ATP-binding protein involved in chromosome partitioning